MSAVRYLVDEPVSSSLVEALAQREPAIDILVIGEELAPPKGTPDPELLRFAEAEQMAIVTNDKNTMRTHVDDHLAAGHHTWGVFLLRPHFPLRRYIDDLVLTWSASQAEEWIDHLEWLPW